MIDYKFYSQTETVTIGTKRIWVDNIIYEAINNISATAYTSKNTIPVFYKNWKISTDTPYFNYEYISDNNFNISFDTSIDDITFYLDNTNFPFFDQGKRKFFNNGSNLLIIDPNGLLINNSNAKISLSKDGYLEIEKIDGEWRIIDAKNIFSTKNPDDISNLEMWIDASQLSGVDGSLVSLWEDQTINNVDFTASGSEQPILKVNIANGKNIVRFDGSANVMSAGDREVFNNTRGLSVIAVVKTNDNTSRQAIISKYQTSGDNRQFAFGNGVNYLFEDLTWGSQSQADITLPQDFVIYEMIWKPITQYTLSANGTLVDTSDNIVNDISDGTANLKIGCGDYTGVGFWDGDIAEVLVYSDELSDQDREDLRNYLTVKWGIPNSTISGSTEDNNAVHVNKASEIESILEKTQLNTNDLFLIEDSEDSFNKKKVSFNTILKGSSITHLDATTGSATITELNHIYYIQASGTLTTITIPDSVGANVNSWLRIYKESGAGIVQIQTVSGQNINNETTQNISLTGEALYIKSVDTGEYYILDDTRRDIPIYISSIGNYLDTEDWLFDTLEFSLSSDSEAIFRSDLVSYMNDGETRFIFNPSSNNYKVFVKTNGIQLDDSEDTVVIDSDGYLEFEKVDNELKIIRSKNTHRGYSVVGDGSDGDVIYNSSSVVNTYTTLVGNQSIGDLNIIVTSSTGLSVGDELMLHQTQDANNGNAGVYEFVHIQNISGTTITLTSALVNDYYSGTFGGDENEATQVIRVPNFNSVDIQSGGMITSTPWVSANGYGGIVAFRVKTDLIFETGNLGINVSEQGFKGGEDNGGGNNAPGDPGESEIGFGWHNDGTTNNCNPNGSGGGGGYGPSGYSGTAGGGGGHLSSGGDAVDGSSPPAIALGGNAIGDTEMSRVFFGGAGGGGGDDDNQTASGAYGGNSGGIIYIACSSSEDTVAISNGENGTIAGGSAGGDGGGGAGGSIYIQALSFSVDTVEALGGNGGSDASGDVGGNGSDGIINVPAYGSQANLVQLVKTSTQSIANGLDTYITWTYNDDMSSCFSWSGSELTFEEKGTYLIQLEGTAELVSGSTRSSVFWRLQLDNGGGYFDLAGTNRGTYHRLDGNDTTSMSITKILNVNAGDSIRLVAIANQNNVQTYSNGCHLIAEKK